MIKSAIALIAGAFSFSCHALTIDGDTVSFSTATPGTIMSNPTAVVGAGVESFIAYAWNPSGSYLNVDISGSTITFSTPFSGVGFGTDWAIEISDIDFTDSPGSVITGFILSASANTIGITDSDVTFTGDSLRFHFGNANIYRDTPVRIQLLASSTSVPDGGATAALLGLGVAGLALARRKS